MALITALVVFLIAACATAASWNSVCEYAGVQNVTFLGEGPGDTNTLECIEREGEAACKIRCTGDPNCRGEKACKRLCVLPLSRLSTRFSCYNASSSTKKEYVLLQWQVPCVCIPDLLIEHNMSLPLCMHIR